MYINAQFFKGTEDRGDGISDNVVVIALDGVDIRTEKTLDGICSGFVHGFTRSDVRPDLMICHRDNVNLRRNGVIKLFGDLIVLCDQYAYAGMNMMRSASVAFYHVKSILFRDGLAQNGIFKG